MRCRLASLAGIAFGSWDQATETAARRATSRRSGRKWTFIAQIIVQISSPSVSLNGLTENHLPCHYVPNARTKHADRPFHGNHTKRRLLRRLPPDFPHAPGIPSRSREGQAAAAIRFCEARVQAARAGCE